MDTAHPAQQRQLEQTDASTRPSPHGHGRSASERADLLTAALVAVTSSTRWSSGPLLIDLHPMATRDVLAPLLLAALPGACPSAPVTAAPDSLHRVRRAHGDIDDPPGATMLNSTVAVPVAAVLDEASASSSRSCESCCRRTAVLQLTWADATFRLCRSCVPVELLPVGLLPPPASAAPEAAGDCALQAAR